MLPENIGKIRIDSNAFVSEMCNLGKRHGCDKSPLNEVSSADIPYRHAYTPIYDLMFSPLKNKPINMAEIGIHKGAGLKLFRDYFGAATLYGFDFNEDALRHCSALQLTHTCIRKLDVSSADAIHRAFEATTVSFDIIIDDSTHQPQDQVNVIRACVHFLKPGGILIIEDIFNDARAPEADFEAVLKELSSELCFSSFIYPVNERVYTGTWNNEKLLMLVKA